MGLLTRAMKENKEIRARKEASSSEEISNNLQSLDFNHVHKRLFSFQARAGQAVDKDWL